MKSILGELRGEIRIKENTALHANVAGNVLLDPEVMLEIHGVVIGDITISANAFCTVYGRVIGDIHNAGGLSVHGIVNGRIVE